MDKISYSVASLADKKEILKLVRNSELTNSSAPWTHLMCGHYYVAKIDNVVVGGGGFTEHGMHPAQTMFLVVDPNYRTRGIGERLQTMRMEGAIELGCTTMHTLAPSDKVADWYVSKFGYIKDTLDKPPYIGLTVDLNDWQQR